MPEVLKYEDILIELHSMWNLKVTVLSGVIHVIVRHSRVKLQTNFMLQRIPILNNLVCIVYEAIT